MKSKEHKFLFNLGIREDYVKYIDDMDFIYFSLHWRNWEYKNPANNREELQSRFIDWIQFLDRNLNECMCIFNEKFHPEQMKRGNLGLEEIMRRLINAYMEIRITDEDIEWISRNNGRQLKFLKARILFISITPQGVFHRNPNFPFATGMTHTQGEKSPFTNNKSSLDFIKNTFMCIDMPRRNKLGIIQLIKQEWEFAVTRNKAVRWIENEDSDIFRTWMKTQRFFMHGEELSYFSKYQQEDFIEFTTLYFDIMTALAPDKSELMIIKLKKAWSQAKTREKNKTKKQVVFSLPIKTKEQLEEICKTTEVPRDKFLQLLIENEYKKFKSKMQEDS